MLTTAPRTIDRGPARWLACYPLFQDALQSGATTFGELPPHAKVAVTKRTTLNVEDHAIAAAKLNDIGASFVELPTVLVEDAVQQYLAKQTGCANSHMARETMSLDELAEQIPSLNESHVARPPCVVQPGQGIFVDGWVRFFSYRARGDTTIPLLAVDWPALHERLIAIL